MNFNEINILDEYSVEWKSACVGVYQLLNIKSIWVRYRIKFLRSTLKCLHMVCEKKVHRRASMLISCLYSISVPISVNTPPVNAAAAACVTTTTAAKWWLMEERTQCPLRTRKTQVLWGQGKRLPSDRAASAEPLSWKISIRISPARKETWKCEGAAPWWNCITFESVFLTTLSVAKLCRVAYKWTSTEHWGNDTDRRKQKQSEKNMSQWNVTLFQACAAVKLDLRSSGMLHSVDW